ncbi:MAG: AAA family ATPase [Clostridia bacterium]|nr:AAA family ATPase [Clostridia bacterium]
MIISVTSLKKGMGQTVSAINLAAMISKIIENKTLIVDINKYYHDIAYYLSNSNFTKGLDEFINLKRTDMIDEEIFLSCVKKVNKNIDIMTSNDCFEIESNDVKALKTYLKKLYPITVIDTISSMNKITDNFLNISDVIVVIINQEKKMVKELERSNKLEKYKDKLIFVINRYIESIDNKMMLYKDLDIEKDIKRAGFNENRIFKLDFDIGLMNDCNDLSLLSYILGNNDTNYLTELKGLSRYILTKYCGYHFEEEEVQRKRKIFSGGKLNFFSF